MKNIIQNKTKRLLEKEPTATLLEKLLVPIPDIKKEREALRIAFKIGRWKK